MFVIIIPASIFICIWVWSYLAGGCQVCFLRAPRPSTVVEGEHPNVSNRTLVENTDAFSISECAVFPRLTYFSLPSFSFVYAWLRRKRDFVYFVYFLLFAWSSIYFPLLFLWKSAGPLNIINLFFSFCVSGGTFNRANTASFQMKLVLSVTLTCELFERTGVRALTASSVLKTPLYYLLLYARHL